MAPVDVPIVGETKVKTQGERSLGGGDGPPRDETNLDLLVFLPASGQSLGGAAVSVEKRSQGGQKEEEIAPASHSDTETISCGTIIGSNLAQEGLSWRSRESRGPGSWSPRPFR